MSLHYLDSEREPRECPGCRNPEKALALHTPCGFCDGSGRLGMAGAEPDVNVFQWGGSSDPKRGWYWCEWPFDQAIAHVGDNFGPFPTEADALTAARAAHREHRPLRIRTSR